MAGIGIGAIFLVMGAVSFTLGQRVPTDIEMQHHFAQLSPPCQQVASSILKAKLLDKQHALTNKEIGKVFGDIDIKRCSEVNRQINQIDRSIDPKTIII